MKSVYEAAERKPGQSQHWENVGYTQLHQLPDLTVTIQWGKEPDEPILTIEKECS